MAFWKQASCPLIELWKKGPFRIYAIHIKWWQINETKNEITELSSKCQFKNYTYGASICFSVDMTCRFTLQMSICSGGSKILYVKMKQLGPLGGTHARCAP